MTTTAPAAANRLLYLQDGAVVADLDFPDATEALIAFNGAIDDEEGVDLTLIQDGRTIITLTSPAVPTAHDLGQRFDHAVTVALHNLPIKARITAPEDMDGYKITRYTHPDGAQTFHVYDDNAWTRPESPTILPWTAPNGEIVAEVSAQGVVTLV